MSRPYSKSQKVFNAAAADATVALDPDFAICPTKIIEIVTVGFSGTLDIQGAVGSAVAKVNLNYTLMSQGTAQVPATAQLSYTTDSTTTHYLVVEPYPLIDFVMTRTAGTITINVFGFGGMGLSEDA